MITAFTLLIRNRLSNYIKEKRNQKIEKQKLSRRGYRCPFSSGRRGPHSKTYITSRGDTNESVKGKKPSRYALEGLNPRESEPSTRNWPKKKIFQLFPLDESWDARLCRGSRPGYHHPHPALIHPIPPLSPTHLILPNHASLRFITKKLIP